MAQTQKMYLGGVPVIKNYLGSDPIVSAGAYPLLLDIDYLVVAGGAGGGEDFSQRDTGGGGAGRFVSSSFSLSGTPSLSVVIGGGGSIQNDGGDSSLIGGGLTIRMNGGGTGGEQNIDSGDGQPGGSGGGACSEFLGGSYEGGTATNGLVSDLDGIGSNGSNGGSNAGAGGGVSTQWYDGVTYCVGGPNKNGTPTTTPGSGGRGGSATSPAKATAGQKGIVKIRYIGEPQATGGTITQSGGYTYHTFNSAGTFTVTG